jgi:hypothetical protein
VNGSSLLKRSPLYDQGCSIEQNRVLKGDCVLLSTSVVCGSGLCSLGQGRVLYKSTLLCMLGMSSAEQAHSLRKMSVLYGTGLYYV